MVIVKPQWDGRYQVWYGRVDVLKLLYDDGSKDDNADDDEEHKEPKLVQVGRKI